MKRLLLSLAIGLGSVVSTSAMAATPDFSTQQMAQTKITELSFKQVMRAFYSGQMTNIIVNDEEIESLPHIGLGAEKDGEQTVAVMHPVITYKNLNDEHRYLVIVEKVLTDSTTHKVQKCHVCRATADVYSFKRLSDGRYQLVSRNHPESIFPSNFGRIQFNASDFQKGLQRLGKNLIGSIFIIDDYFSGTTYNFWEALHLPEDEYILNTLVGDAGSNNVGVYGKGSPLYYEYDVDYRVVVDSQLNYYPILLNYKGDKPLDEDDQHIESVNYFVSLEYDPIKRVYKQFDSLPVKIYNIRHDDKEPAYLESYQYDLLSEEEKIISLYIDVLEAAAAAELN